MAMLLFQFCLVSAVGFFFGPASALLGSRALSLDSPPSLPGSLDQPPRRNVTLRFLEEPTDVFVAPGTNATLHCDVESTSGSFTLSWIYEGRPIKADDSRWSVLFDGTVLNVLHVAEEENAGQYACLAKNEWGALLSRSAMVRVATLDKDLTVITSNSKYYESQPVLLSCNVSSSPPADIRWEYNQLPLLKDNRYVPLPNGALLIIDTKYKDSGKYRCLAENSVLNKTKYSKELEVDVVPPPTSGLPPNILVVDSLINRTVLIGETVQLVCVGIGWPKPTVQWMYNKTVPLGTSPTLTIRNASLNDTGNYSCIATNPTGRKVQKYRLDVYQSPFFNTTPASKISPSAKTVRLECQPIGVPQPQVFWLKNGEPLAQEVRIKKLPTGLVFSHTVSTDSGTYQCMAVNSVGKIWAAAQIEINNSQSPSPPRNVRCRPFDQTSVCLTWKTPPNISVQAYSVYSFYFDEDEKQEVSGPEYLTTEAYRHADGLKPGTNYTFYVRLYSRHASDHSERVTCQPVLKGSRNLDIVGLSSTSVSLRWDKLSSDVLCNGTKDTYTVEWYRDGDELHLFTEFTYEKKFIVTGLLPSTDYQFRVVTMSHPQDETWTMFSMPDIEELANDTADGATELRAPKYLREEVKTSTSVKIVWEKIPNAKFYTICCVPAKEEEECEDGDFIKSFSPRFSTSKLTPNTDYVFKVRAHDANNVPGAISQPLFLHTLSDVPSPVVDLQYKAVNASTACIHWRPPENSNGELKHYVVSYTTDSNWSLENLVEFPVSLHPKKTCLQGLEENSDAVSTLLTNLSTEYTYMVMVQAVNEIGIGQPLVSTVVKTFDTDKLNEMYNIPEDVAYKQKVGIVLGVLLALLCILFCITFILLRRRCLKRRAVARARMAMSSNYHPAVAHYTTQLGSVQVRMEQPCSAEEHEIQHLVSDDQQPARMPPVTPDHLDTKGAPNFPNGYVNGTTKPPQLNGIIVNGHVHITENPQYYAYNGNMAKNKSEPLLKHYEEDSNSNVNPSKFRDFYNFFDNSGKFKNASFDKPTSNGHLDDSFGSFNSTQLTVLDDSLTGHRRLSPVLEPNG